MASVVRRYGTGYLRTTVIQDDGGSYLWVRQPGPDRAAIDRLDPALRAVIGRIRGTSVVLAMPELDEACRAWQDLQAPYECARARVLLADACRRLGDADGADLELAAAAEAFRRLGAVPAGAPRARPCRPHGSIRCRAGRSPSHSTLWRLRAGT